MSTFENMFNTENLTLKPEIKQFESKGAKIYIFSYPKNIIRENLDLSELDLENNVLYEKTDLGKTTREIWIKASYRSENIEFEYADNSYIDEAKIVSDRDSLDKNMPNGSVIVSKGQIIGFGANGSKYHEEHGCERVRLEMPSGQGYELCEGCSPKNHGEPSALKNVDDKHNQNKLEGSELYMYGHWWCCKDCNRQMEYAGIKKVYIGKKWTKDFLGIDDIVKSLN